MPKDIEKDASSLERERMHDVTEDFRNRKPRPLSAALSRLLITLSYAIVSSLILSLLVQAFTRSTEAGIRSLAAATLPPLVITYLTLFNRSFRPPQNVSRSGLYIISTIWMIAMLFLTNYFTNYAGGISVGVLILSITLSGLIFLNKHIPFPAALSSSFGIVTGLLLYALIFGIPGT